MSVRSLVTGGAGFIGSHVVKALLSRGDAVRVLHLPGEDLRNLDGLDVERIPGDVRDRAKVASALRGVDRLFHLAAVYALWTPNPPLLREVNVEGTRIVLTAARDAGVSKVVYTSSIAVFGGQGPGRLAHEECAFALGNTGDLYSRTKYEAHRVARGLAAEGLPVVIVAPCSPLGPGDVGPTPTGRLLLSAVNLPVAVVADAVSNVVDVRDVAEGHVLAAERGAPGRSYLLGNENLRLAELVSMASDILGEPRPCLTLPTGALYAAGVALTAWSDLVSHRPPLLTAATARITALGLGADVSRAVNELGLPRRPVKESIEDALRWFARHGYVKSPRLAARLSA